MAEQVIVKTCLLGIEFQAGHQRVLNLLYNLRNIHKIFIHERITPFRVLDPLYDFPEVCGCTLL